MTGRLTDLIAQKIDPEPMRVNAPSFRRMDSLDTRQPAAAAAAYERDVFNFLLAHRTQLGIREVWRCRSVRIDGLLELNGGQRLGLEVKYRMNWEKASQAGQQFSWYLNRPAAKTRPIDGGLVVFEEFSGHWGQRKPPWLLENGWNFWYMDHQYVEKLRVDLVQFRAGTLDSFPTALAAARAAPQRRTM